jgi:hypothetical protein
MYPPCYQWMSCLLVLVKLMLASIVTFPYTVKLTHIISSMSFCFYYILRCSYRVTLIKAGCLLEDLHECYM